MTVPNPIDVDPLLTDEDVLRRARDLVQRAFRRQLWLLLVDDEHRQLPVLPQIDIPRVPDARAVRDFVDMLCEMARAAGAVETAIVYERPGPERLSVADRRWLRLLADGSPRDVAVRGPLLAHARGVRWIGPEDLDDPSPPG